MFLTTMLDKIKNDPSLDDEEKEIRTDMVTCVYEDEYEKYRKHRENLFNREIVNAYDYFMFVCCGIHFLRAYEGRYGDRKLTDDGSRVKDFLIEMGELNEYEQKIFELF